MPAGAYLREAVRNVHRFFSLFMIYARQMGANTGLKLWHSAGMLYIRIRGTKIK